MPQGTPTRPSKKQRKKQRLLRTSTPKALPPTKCILTGLVREHASVRERCMISDSGAIEMAVEYQNRKHTLRKNRVTDIFNTT